MKVKELKELLEKKGEKLSKAKRLKSLLEKQKTLMGSKQKLVDFVEPVVFLIKRDGEMDIWENATAGKFVFEHSTKKARFIELRPADQVKFNYANRKVRSYVAHEDRPFSGWENPIVDSESIMLGYEKTKATDLKYQERIEELKRKGKMTWVWIILAIVLGLGFAIMIIPDTFWDRIFRTGKYVAQNPEVASPTVGLILLSLRKSLNSKGALR